MSVTTRPPAPDAGVIEDARSRQRAQRRAGAVVALAVLVGALWLGFAGGGGGGGSGAGRGGGHQPTPLGALTAQGPPVITTTALRSSQGFFTIEPYRGSLLLTGYDSNDNECVWMLVAPHTLHVRETFRASCSAPALAAESFVPVEVEHQDLTSSVRVARPNREPRRVVLGPVVMLHNEVSDTHLEWAYGAGLLWIYDVAAIDPAAIGRHQGRRNPHAEVVEVSLATGRVVRVVRTPPLYRPYAVADDDGLWLVPSPETSGGSPAATYLLAPGAGAPRVLHRFGDAAIWAVASGHTLWEDVRHLSEGTLLQELWRLDGTSGAARLIGPLGGLGGAGPPVLAPSNATFWTLNSLTDPGTNNTCTRQQVVAVDGASARTEVVARPRLPLDPCEPVPFNQPYGGVGEGETFADGAFYFIDSGQYASAPTALYRVVP